MSVRRIVGMMYPKEMCKHTHYTDLFKKKERIVDYSNEVLIYELGIFLSNFHNAE